MTVGVNERYPAYRAKNELRNRQRREAEKQLMSKNKVICPECKKAGNKSKVYSLGTTSTLMAYQPYYDEDGNYHIHDLNIRSAGFKCSNGHDWVEGIKNPCPQGDYE